MGLRQSAFSELEALLEIMNRRNSNKGFYEFDAGIIVALLPYLSNISLSVVRF